jgi:exonuclease SbcC
MLTVLEKAYGRDGVPVLILESTAIPQVEAEAQRVLGELGMPFRVELVTQRENKGGGLKDTLDVVVHEPNGARRYETYSGGERTRVEMALRVALARLIAHRRSTPVGMLALDEPSFLDATGMAQLTGVLRGLTEFRSVVLVSHDDRLVDGFDNRVVVVRDERGSRLEAPDV